MNHVLLAAEPLSGGWTPGLAVGAAAAVLVVVYLLVLMSGRGGSLREARDQRASSMSWAVTVAMAAAVVALGLAGAR